ncbi:7342_t:CDS:2 [Paraglomus brasilianum]|uniref:7342_t:CDS:1 n=1 Tax=Paraglomus brasilianum TaxID=144538 RepID=A0A9N9AGR1_9GLOM|nr:7342_t:CDS:2 [Paraglomus brasilianum]
MARLGRCRRSKYIDVITSPALGQTGLLTKYNEGVYSRTSQPTAVNNIVQEIPAVGSGQWRVSPPVYVDWQGYRCQYRDGRVHHNHK